jgi:nondiscriminating glutamyl-tRNA synthetase
MSFRTRQAPSPTGYLHLGTARQMLFTALFAKINQGVWYLRVEDTDRQRLVPEAVTNMLNALQEVGLTPDEGVTLTKIGRPDQFYGVYQHGEFGPYIQSERQELYLKYAQELIDRRLAYWNFLNESERQELQEIKQTSKRPINYFQVCGQKRPEDLYLNVDKALNHEAKPALMYKLQRNEKLPCQDELLGQTVFDLSLEEDFVILKSDGFPTYHLAHLVDDHLMQTSLAIRGQEWLASLPKHVTMFQDFWGSQQVINYMHLPVILAENGNKKLSKRDGNVNVQDYLDQGYLPEAILNYLAFLGWNPGTEKELYLSPKDFQ